MQRPSAQTSVFFVDITQQDRVLLLFDYFGGHYADFLGLGIRELS